MTHLPRHLRNSHEYSNNEAKKFVASRRHIIRSNTAKRAYWKCPVMHCNAVVQWLQQHIRTVHKFSMAMTKEVVKYKKSAHSDSSEEDEIPVDIASDDTEDMEEEQDIAQETVSNRESFLETIGLQQTQQDRVRHDVSPEPEICSNVISASLGTQQNTRNLTAPSCSNIGTASENTMTSGMTTTTTTMTVLPSSLRFQALNQSELHHEVTDATEYATAETGDTADTDDTTECTVPTTWEDGE